MYLCLVNECACTVTVIWLKALHPASMFMMTTFEHNPWLLLLKWWSNDRAETWLKTCWLLQCCVCLESLDQCSNMKVSWVMAETCCSLFLWIPLSVLYTSRNCWGHSFWIEMSLIFDRYRSNCGDQSVCMCCQSHTRCGRHASMCVTCEIFSNLWTALTPTVEWTAPLSLSSTTSQLETY